MIEELKADLLAVKALFRAMFAGLDDETLSEIHDNAADVIENGTMYPNETKQEAVSALANILDLAA